MVIHPFRHNAQNARYDASPLPKSDLRLRIDIYLLANQDQLPYLAQHIFQLNGVIACRFRLIDDGTRLNALHLAVQTLTQAGETLADVINELEGRIEPTRQELLVRSPSLNEFDPQGFREGLK